MQAIGPVQQLRLSGIVKFGSVGTIGGATLAGFDLPTAQGLFGKPGKLDEIAVASKSSVPTAQLLAEIRGILPKDTEVRTGQAQAHEDSKDTNAFISFLQKFLLGFAGRGPLRRELRDRELALDHDRPAHARARNVADTRRLA